jgi:hypothetical protein
MLYAMRNSSQKAARRLLLGHKTIRERRDMHRNRDWVSIGEQERGRMASRWIRLFTTLVGALLVGLAACAPSVGRPTGAAPPAAPAAESPEWQQTLAAARREGAVTVAGPPQPAEREAIMRFREAYPDIALEYVGLLGQDYLHRVETEYPNGIRNWDVFIGGVSTQYDYIPKG